MTKIIYGALGIMTAALAVMASSKAISAQDKYSLQVPDLVLAFAQFKGYENWQVVSVSQNGGRFAVILGNRAAISAYRAGIPANGEPFPDGAKIAKIHWNPRKNAAQPGEPLVPDTLNDAHFMVKDSKLFPDSGGWGYAAFQYDSASNTFRPATLADNPPQANGVTCGAACHTVVKGRDFVFTAYSKR